MFSIMTQHSRFLCVRLLVFFCCIAGGNANEQTGEFQLLTHDKPQGARYHIDGMSEPKRSQIRIMRVSSVRCL